METDPASFAIGLQKASTADTHHIQCLVRYGLQASPFLQVTSAAKLYY